MTVSKELIAASSRPIILSILSKGEDYGYSIIRKVDKASDGEMAWTEGMLYPVLHRLARDGVVKSEWKSSENGPRRKYYRLTAKGRRSLVNEREQWFFVHQTLARLWGGSPCST